MGLWGKENIKTEIRKGKIGLDWKSVIPGQSHQCYMGLGCSQFVIIPLSLLDHLYFNVVDQLFLTAGQSNRLGLGKRTREY